MPWSKDAGGDAWLQPNPILWSRQWGAWLQPAACALVPGGRLQTNTDSLETFGCNQRIFYVNDRVHYGNTKLAKVAAYAEADVTIRIRSSHYYSAEYRIAIHPTIRPRSEYEANIRYSPTWCLTRSKAFV